jgi:hypothetical protein
MKVGNVVMAFVLAGCSIQAQDTGFKNDLPVESVSCTHPDSDYEAVVEVMVEDDYGWEDIHFQIHQGAETWDTLLWAPNEEDAAWRTRMQLIELNCRIEYDYDFVYIEVINESR